MTPIPFGTKAETLERLAPALTTAQVLPQVRLTVREWHEERSAVLHRLRQNGWLDRPVIVRSSALREDGCEESLAGQFASVPQVQEEAAVIEAIDCVVQSYTAPVDGDQIFLQPQLTDLTVNGVAFSVDPVTGGPYVVINDQRCPHTGEVTGGMATDDELFYWLKGTAFPQESHLAAVLRLIAELERLLDTAAIDVEFAWAAETLFLLQVRPLVRMKTGDRSAADCTAHLTEIATVLQQRSSASPRVLGEGIAWGAMPDWNPAEMIGLRPRPLAAGLYRECITDRIWAEQRRRYGYRDVVGVPLMECFGGQALINIRASFTSFVPANLPDETARKLVQHYLDGLKARPELHDKVEMELVLHCWTFDLTERLAEVARKAELTSQECTAIERSLFEITVGMLNLERGPWAEDRQRMKAFEDWLSARPHSSESVAAADLHELLRRCRDEGACAFAGLARVGFVAVCLVNSLVDIGVWSEADRDQFFRSPQTVLSRMQSDRASLSEHEFLSQYGHLRPGTYDILVPRYDEAPQHYLGSKLTESPAEIPPFILKESQSRDLANVLHQHGIHSQPDEFINILRSAIELREYGKFVYSRGISELLRMLGEYAAEHGFAREDCAYAAQSLWNDAENNEDFPKRLRDAIAEGQASTQAARGIALPPLLLNLDDIWSFRMPRCQPNFITHGEACGPVRELHPGINSCDLDGAVLLLPAADPGFDWIFSTGIVAFVTKFGGANSHMAIRSREWNLPAAIGVGEVRYRRLVQARALRVDCLHQLLVTLP